MPRCKHCNKKFEPKAFLQKYCMDNEKCIGEYWNKIKSDQERNKKKKATAERKSRKNGSI